MLPLEKATLTLGSIEQNSDRSLVMRALSITLLAGPLTWTPLLEDRGDVPRVTLKLLWKCDSASLSGIR